MACSAPSFFAAFCSLPPTTRSSSSHSSSALSVFSPSSLKHVYGLNCRRSLSASSPSVVTASNVDVSRSGDAGQPQRGGALQQSKSSRRPFSLLGSWDPFSRGGLRQVMEMMDSVFDDDWSTWPASGPGAVMRPASTGSIRTPWDVIEDDEAYHIRVDMPGFSKEDVKVRVENASLVVTGERDPSKEDERWASKSYSKFKTRLSLPDDAHSEKITAEMRNGVLCLAIPKLKPEEKHHVINVEIV